MSITQLQARASDVAGRLDVDGCPVRAGIRQLTEDASIEILPSEAEKRIGSGTCRLREDTRVYIAYTSGGCDDIVRAAQIVSERRLIPVPHVPARRFHSLAELRNFIEALATRASVRQVLLIGGDNERPAGPFEATIDVLRTGLLQANGIRTFGVAGHPDGHPLVSPQALEQALVEKLAYATQAGMDMYLVTQFLFDATRLFHWRAGFGERALRDIPVDVGLPGLARATTLLRFAAECGVATSLGMLTKNAARAFRLATTFSPEESLIELADGLYEGGKPRFRSVHFFPFGSFERTSAWLQALSLGNFRVDFEARCIHTD